MITVNDVSLNFSGQTLFKHVDLKFVPGNCYGIIGANGAGKTTFLRILSGDLEPTTGEVVISKDDRMSVLKQDHFQYDAYTVLDTVILGNQHLYDVMKEKDALYEKEDFSDEDGVRASELEAEFAEMGGWEAESDVSRLIQGLGLSNDILYSEMSTLTAKEKVKVLLAQALFGKPDIILLDEPTNHLDIQAIEWLEDFIMDCESLIIVVSHDRHFLNTVCTSIVDVDYGGIRMYVGNYEFWYESSQLMQRMIKDQNRKKEDKIKELQEFISRFSANKSKSKQATARRKLLDKLTVEEMPASSRRYPFVGFKMDREPGKEILNKGSACPASLTGAWETLWRTAHEAIRHFAVLNEARKSAQTVRLAGMLCEEFARDSRRDGNIPAVLVPLKAREALSGEFGVPEALCRLGSRLRHFMLDEFQDTSRQQWQAMHPLVGEALAQGGTLTWVGDVKQAIYGWRGGDTRLFDELAQDAELVATLILQAIAIGQRE